MLCRTRETYGSGLFGVSCLLWRVRTFQSMNGLQPASFSPQASYQLLLCHIRERPSWTTFMVAHPTWDVVALKLYYALPKNWLPQPPNKSKDVRIHLAQLGSWTCLSLCWSIDKSWLAKIFKKNCGLSLCVFLRLTSSLVPKGGQQMQ